MALLTPTSSLPILVLNKGRERSLVNRHPWVFSGAVGKRPAGAVGGDVVQVVSAEGQWLALGFYSPESQITVRCFEFDRPDADPTQGPYWRTKLDRALALRTRLNLAAQATTCQRLLHAEGDEMPGFIADAYGDTVVLQVLTLGAERVLPHLEEGLRVAGYRYIYLKIKENSAWLEHVSLKAGWLGEEGAAEVEVQEHGMRFLVNVVEGQKTGFFLDQRDARALLQTYAQGAKVLNTFSYTGGFSLAALAGGATQAISVDISKAAVEQAHRNAALNGWGDDRHQAVAADCFDYFRQAPDDLDIIVLDPPAFAKKESALKNATRGYKELNLKALKRLKPGGLLFTFSCSQAVSRDLFRKIVFGAAADARRHVRILHQTTQPPDHPISIYHPEGEYLKGLVLEVE